MNALLKEYAVFARENLVPTARDNLKQLFTAYGNGEDLGTETKSDGTPASRADREMEQMLREMIAAAYPAHGIAGEEFGVDNPEAEFVWVLDPLDGTKEFLAKEAGWGSLIALMQNGKPVLGAIIDPLQNKVWDQGDQPVAKPKPCALEQAVIATTTTKRMFEGTAYEQGAHALFSRCASVRERLNCLGYAYALGGGVTIAAENDIKLHDIAALLPALWAAGATCRNFEREDYKNITFDLKEAASARYNIVAGLDADLVGEVLGVLNGRAV